MFRIPQDIGWAVKQINEGGRVCRSGWNGRGMFLFLVSGGEMEHPAVGKVEASPYVAMKTAQGDVVPWLCSQTDLRAVDWEMAD